MTEPFYQSALIVGAGPGLGAALARAFRTAGLTVGLVARNQARLAPLAASIGATTFSADASDRASVAHLFEDVDRRLGVCDVVVFNAAPRRAHGPLASLDPDSVRENLAISAYGAFLVLREAVMRMVPRQKGALLLTGASASIKGFRESAPFAMGKFALRGLAESAARELGPKGIHVAHFIIDGAIRTSREKDPSESTDSTLDPDAIAQTYLATLRQPRSAWSFETALRPWVEKF